MPLPPILSLGQPTLLSHLSAGALLIVVADWFVPKFFPSVWLFQKGYDRMHCCGIWKYFDLGLAGYYMGVNSR